MTSSELFFRTEDFTDEEIEQIFVSSDWELSAIEALKSRTPVLLSGSRGVGKSYLLKVAERQMAHEFREKRVLPVYVSFIKVSVLQTAGTDLTPWMAGKLRLKLERTLSRFGIKVSSESGLSKMIGGSETEQAYVNAVEASIGKSSVDHLPTPYIDIEEFLDDVEDLCHENGIKRVVFLIDEAAHVFKPAQQRQFFTLMRDLRSPYVSVKAAVYPGTTSYGESFERSHDAKVVKFERSLTGRTYYESMREMVLKQLDMESSKTRANQKKEIDQRGDLFDSLAAASMGNPRVLLKTYSESGKLNRSSVEGVLKSHYRTEIWADHSRMAERFPGHERLIDWGRKFIEESVIPDIHERNSENVPRYAAFWVHRDAPQAVTDSLKLLAYSGIVSEGERGMKATRSEIGTRYVLNFGCIAAASSSPLSYLEELRQNYSIKRMVEYGANHEEFQPLQDLVLLESQEGEQQALVKRLEQSSDILDLTDFQKKTLSYLGLKTLKDVLQASDETFKSAPYVGDKRARRLRNAATAAVVEYLSG